MLAAALIICAGFGGAALAQGNNEDSQSDTLTARVARILGIDQQQLEDAVSQARTEIQEENQDRHLQNLIDKGIITEEEAEAIKEGSLPLPGMEKFRQRMKERLCPEFDLEQFRAKMREWCEPDSDGQRDSFSGNFGFFRDKGDFNNSDELNFPSN